MGSNLNPIWNIWNVHPEFKLKNTSFTLKGFSIAALRTNFFIKELNIMLDAGLSANLNPDHIFVTHTHTDHSANLPFHLYSVNQIKVYVPEESLNKFKNYVESGHNLSTESDDAEYDSSDSYLFVKVKAGDKFQIEQRGQKIEMETIQCYHTVPCVGYGFIEKRFKLKEEYLGLTGKEIVQLKKDGININREVENPFLCFLGDTDKTVLLDETIYKYNTIMIECTFLPIGVTDDIPQADKTKHIHWKYLEPVINSHPDNFFILYHFSQRYTRDEINNFFHQMNLPNVFAWVSN